MTFFIIVFFIFIAGYSFGRCHAAFIAHGEKQHESPRP